MGIVFEGQNIKNTCLNREGDGGEEWEEGGGGERGGEGRGGEGEEGRGNCQTLSVEYVVGNTACSCGKRYQALLNISGDRLETWLVQIFQPVVSRARDTRDKLLVVKHLS